MRQGVFFSQPSPPGKGDAPPEGGAFNLPLRGRGTAAAVEEGRHGRERLVSRASFSCRSRPLRPSSVSLTRASTTFYGIAATGSYFRFNSLRDAPPEGEALNLPLRGRGTAAAVEEGRYGRERCVFISRSRPERPSSVRAAPCQLPRRGSFFTSHTALPAPPARPGPPGSPGCPG